MSARPVLDAIRALLKFKDFTTVSEIASTAEVRRRVVLDILNANGQYVWRDRKSGKITRVDPRTDRQKQLWESGKYYAEDTFGMFSVEGHSLKFHGNDELRNRLMEKRWIGAFGDSCETAVILDTPANRAAIEAAGLTPWSQVLIDDSLWREALNA